MWVGTRAGINVHASIWKLDLGSSATPFNPFHLIGSSLWGKAMLPGGPASFPVLSRSTAYGPCSMNSEQIKRCCGLRDAG